MARRELKNNANNHEKNGRVAGAKWIGTGAGVSGAIMIALNLGLVIYGFGLFLISSLLWSVIPKLANAEARDYDWFARAECALSRTARRAP